MFSMRELEDRSDISEREILLLSYYILGSGRFYTMVILISRMFSTTVMHVTNLRPDRLALLTVQPLWIRKFWAE